MEHARIDYGVVLKGDNLDIDIDYSDLWQRTAATTPLSHRLTTPDKHTKQKNVPGRQRAMLDFETFLF